MKENKFHYVFKLNDTSGRNDDNYRDITDRWDEDAWLEATDVLREFTYSHGANTAKVSANLKHYYRRLRKSNRLVRKYYEPNVDPYSIRFPRSPVRIPVEVTITATADPKNVASRDWYPEFFAELYFHDLFIIMNLSTPGCCEFYNLYHKGVGKRARTTRYQLSAFGFDWAVCESLDGMWPKVSTIPLRDVANWYRKLGTGILQRAQTQMQRVIFDLLNIARSELSPLTIVWLFHALEALYETEIGESFRKLVARSGLLLSPPPNKKKGMQRQLRKLFDLRSKIVHGGFEAWHPMHNEAFDRELEASYSKVSAAEEYGFRLLLASVQEMIRRDYTSLTFEDRMVPHA